MNPKAFFEVIQGALITEIGEMEAFNRAELTKVTDATPEDRVA